MKSRYIALLAIVFAFVGGTASAATVTLYGDDVSFTFDDATLFGSGTVVGNNIFFLPTEYKAESLNGEGIVSENSVGVSTNVTLEVVIEATTGGYEMTDFLLAESGDYLLNGAGASVDLQGQLAVTSNTSGPPPFGFPPYRAEEFFDAGPLTVNTGSLTAWDASAAINLADYSGWGSDTKVTMQIENIMSATTLNEGVGEQAFIEKKFEAVGIIVNPIPIPPALILFPSALGALAWVRRRKAGVA